MESKINYAVAVGGLYIETTPGAHDRLVAALRHAGLMSTMRVVYPDLALALEELAGPSGKRTETEHTDTGINTP
jgi:hypothetical protein